MTLLDWLHRWFPDDEIVELRDTATAAVIDNGVLRHELAAARSALEAVAATNVTLARRAEAAEATAEEAFLRLRDVLGGLPGAVPRAVDWARQYAETKR